MNTFLVMSAVLFLAGVSNIIHIELYINMITEMFSDIKDGLSPYVMVICYNLLYGFSVCQIKVNKYYKVIDGIVSPYVILFNNYIRKSENNLLIKSIDKNGNIKDIYDLLKNRNNVNKNISSDCNSLWILYDIVPSKYVNKVCFTEITQLTKMVEQPLIEYKESNINFMMIELEHNDKIHMIELKNDCHNYYIVNNCLNQNFFKYYLKNILEVAINEDNFDYCITIVDHNVNVIKLSPEQSIMFNENDYTVFPVPEKHTSISREIDSDTDKNDDFVKLYTETT
jgi:hypothetical protein